MCLLCILMQVARSRVLYAFCCFLPSRSPAMGNLIKVLGKDLENCPHFFLDFESKWAPGLSACVRVVELWACGVEVCGRGGGGARRGMTGCELLSWWWFDGVLLRVWFVINRHSLVPLSTRGNLFVLWTCQPSTEIRYYKKPINRNKPNQQPQRLDRKIEDSDHR